MNYRKWDPKTKAKIILEGLQNNQPISELCNNYQISQNQYYNWLKEFQSKSHNVLTLQGKQVKNTVLWMKTKNLNESLLS